MEESALPVAFSPEPPATTWQGALKRLHQRLDAMYEYKPVISLRFPAAERFVDWAQNAGLDFLATKWEDVSDAYRKSLDGMFGPNAAKAVKIAQLLLDERGGENPGPPLPARGKGPNKKKSREPEPEEPEAEVEEPDAEPDDTPPPEITAPEPNPVSKDTASMATQHDDTEPTTEDEEDGPEPEVEEEEEAAPKRRPAPRAQQVFVAMPQRRMAPRGAAQPRSTLLPRMEKVRIHKRGPGGARIYIGDYTTQDIGSMDLNRFIKEFVDPEQGDPSGTTKYEACPVNAQDKEHGTPAQITISNGAPPQQPDSVSQIRDVVDLVNDLRSVATDEQRANQELLLEAKRKAMGNGDMSQLLMLMMMQNMSRPQNDIEGMVKVAERLHGGKSEHHGPSGGIQFLPPPLPPQNGHLDKMMELMLAKAMAPAPTFMEQMQQMQMMNQLLHPPNAMQAVVDTLKAEMAALRAAVTAQAPQPAAAPGSIDAALGTFEKLSTVVKTLAPTLNAGGITGMLQSVFTPELMKTVGNVAASALQNAGVGVAPGQAPAGAKPQLPAGQQAAPAPTRATAPAPRAPAQPELPQAIVDAGNALRIAQTREVQLQATTALLQAMYLGPFRQNLEPVLQELMQGQVERARAVLGGILKEVRPDLNQPTFIEDTMRLLFTQNGVPLPAALGGGPVATAAAAPDTRPDAKVIPIVTPPPIEEAYAAQIEAAEKAKQAELAKAPAPAPTNGAHAETPPVEVTKFEKEPAAPQPSA